MAIVQLSNLTYIVKHILQRLPEDTDRATVIAFRGGVGAGKTTLIQALAAEFGIEGSVQSPTYVLMKSYKIPPVSLGGGHLFERLVHIDAYRLESPEQFSALQPETFLSDPQTLVCIEWPENLGAELPHVDITVKISQEGLDPEERDIEVI